MEALIMLVGLLGGAFVGQHLARMLGVATKEVEVGRVGDQPVYQYQGTLLGALLGMAGAAVGLVAAVVIAQMTGVFKG